MLKINNNEYDVLLSEIRLASASYNNKKGYSPLISLDIMLNNKKGYISFYVDFFDNNLLKNIENKKYVEIPTKLNSKISMIEIYDTKNFIDNIDSEVILEFKSIEDNKILTKLNIDDKLIKLEYEGLLNIKD